MVQSAWTLARNTFTETIRQPIYGVILLTTAALLILNVSLAGFTLDDDDKLLLDLGLSTLLLSGLFLSAFSAAGVVSREIENKTVLTVVSKPVARPVFILGKFAGLLAALVLAFYLSFLVFLLAQRHGVLERTSDPWDAPVLVFGFASLALSFLAAGFCNYFYGWGFPATTLVFITPMLTASVLAISILDEHWNFIPFASNFVGGQIILATYLVLLTIIIMAAVALAASTRFGQVMTLLICTAVLGLGISSDYAFGQSEEAVRWASIAYRAVPNLGMFWVIDGLTADSERTTISAAYLLYTSAYAMLITTGVLGIAVASFQKREVG